MSIKSESVNTFREAEFHPENRIAELAMENAWLRDRNRDLEAINRRLETLRGEALKPAPDHADALARMFPGARITIELPPRD